MLHGVYKRAYQRTLIPSVTVLSIVTRVRSREVKQILHCVTARGSLGCEGSSDTPKNIMPKYPVKSGAHVLRVTETMERYCMSLKKIQLNLHLLLFLQSCFISNAAIEGPNFQNMYAGPRRHIPMHDLILQRELQVCEENNLDSYLCPCRKCHGGHQYAVRTIQMHLRAFQRNPFLMHSMVGGNPQGGYPEDGIWIRDQVEPVPNMNVFDDADMHIKYQDHLDPYHDIQQQLHDTFDLGDRLQEETPHVFEDGVQEDNYTDDVMPDLDNLDALYWEGTKPVYGGTNVSTISASIILINMVVIHNINNAYVDELLKYLTTMLLPRENCLPKSHYEAKKIDLEAGT